MPYNAIEWPQAGLGCVWNTAHNSLGLAQQIVNIVLLAQCCTLGCMACVSPVDWACACVQVALRAIVSSLAHDDSLVQDVRQAFEELEHGHTGSIKNATLLQVRVGIYPW